MCAAMRCRRWGPAFLILLSLGAASAWRSAHAPAGGASAEGVPTVTGAVAQTTAQAAAQTTPRQILDATGTTGGLIVHLGCGDGQLTAALAQSAAQGCVVQGLERDAQKVEQARRHLRSLGIYGPVSVAGFEGPKLPYADNLVNLLLIERPELMADHGLTQAEIRRVLVPRGVAYLKQGTRGIKTVNPRPDAIDEWTHYLHDASNNAVAHDLLVGPPRRLQWTAGPPHMRSHEHIPGLYALVSSGGRIFYIVDEAPIASIRCTPRWRLAARDAFNGVLLWERPLEDWFPHIVNWGQTPRQLERKLVAAGDRVFVTLGLHAPVSMIDAATGRTLAEYEKTAGTEEILFHEGTLLLVVRRVTPECSAEQQKWTRLLAEDDSPAFEREKAQPLVEQLRRAERSGAVTIRALDGQSGRLRWEKHGDEVAGLRTESLCAAGERVFYQRGGNVVCVALDSGKTLWSTPCSTLYMVAGDTVYCCSGERVTALAAQTGRKRWTASTELTQVRDVFLAGGSLWVGGFKPFPSKRGPSWGPYFATQIDPATGKMLRQVAEQNPGHHHRCYRNKATDRYIFAGRRGTELIDLSSGDVLWHNWARGVCRYGVMPCNGLLYAPPHACGCYMSAKLMGFNALAPDTHEPRASGRASASEQEASGSGSVWQPASGGPVQQAGSAPTAGATLQRGPAYADAAEQQSHAPDAAAWPTYRADSQRSGCARSAVRAELRLLWQTKVGAKLTAPTVGSGRLLVAAPDEHCVAAMDARSGRMVWDFTAGARVDSPPTIFRGRAIFGCRDGSVYSLRVSDGVPAWKLHPARESRLIVADGQLESAWPVHGSVLVCDGAAYFTAGRSSYLDGGIDLCRVDALSGENLSRTNIYSPDPETGRQPRQFGPASMPGARSDLLSGDGQHVYLRDMVFDLNGNPQPDGPAHLLAMTGFLDDTWAHRSYLIFGTHWSAALGCSGRDRNLVYGRLLVFDEKMIYGYGRNGVHWSNQLQDGPYRLFAVRRGESAPQWTAKLPITARAMLLAGDVLFLAGPASPLHEWAETFAVRTESRSTESTSTDGAGAQGASADDATGTSLLLAVSASDGSVLARRKLPGEPIFDGLAAADGRLYVSLTSGAVACFGAQ